MKTVFVTAGALVDEHGDVLMTSRPAGKEFAGCWEFPGGKIEPGEDPETGLCRELKEELGIDVDAAACDPVTFVSYPYEKFHLVMLLYVCRRWTGTPIPREHQTVRFVDPEKMADLRPLPPADKDLIPRLRDYLTC